MNDLPFVLLDNLILAAIDHSFWVKQPGYCGVDWARQDDIVHGGCSRIPFFFRGVPWDNFR